MFHPSPSSHKPHGKRSHQATQHAGRHLVLLIEEFRRVPQEALRELGDVPGRGKNQELKQFFRAVNQEKHHQNVKKCGRVYDWVVKTSKSIWVAYWVSPIDWSFLTESKHQKRWEYMVVLSIS